MKKNIPWILSFLTFLFFACQLNAQPRGQGGRPPVRKHTVTESGDLKLNPVVQKLSQKSVSKFKESKKEIKAQWLASHNKSSVA